MEGVWARWGHVLLATAVAVPVLVAVVTLRARAFASTGPVRSERRGWWVAAAEVGAIAGTLPWLWMILTPLPQPAAVHPVPFQEVSGYLSVPPTEAVVQVVGNLAVFAAAGALAPVRWRLGRGTGAVLAVVAGCAAAGSVLVETLQWALHLGRVTSVDDVLLNTAGALLAAAMTRRWWRT